MKKTCFLFKKAVRRSVADQKIPARNSRVHLIHAQDNISDDDDELVVAPPKRKEPASQLSSDEDDFDAVFPARHAAK